MTDGLPNPTPAAELPSQVNGFINLFLTHALTLAAGALAAKGALSADQTSMFVQVGSALALYAIGQGTAWLLQHLRHTQAVAAVASAKAS
jgi:hypothetical protein